MNTLTKASQPRSNPVGPRDITIVCEVRDWQKERATNQTGGICWIVPNVASFALRRLSVCPFTGVGEWFLRLDVHAAKIEMGRQQAWGPRRLETVFAASVKF